LTIILHHTTPREASFHTLWDEAERRIAAKMAALQLGEDFAEPLTIEPEPVLLALDAAPSIAYETEEA
jgi:hypothetical protein